MSITSFTRAPNLRHQIMPEEKRLASMAGEVAPGIIAYHKTSEPIFDYDVCVQDDSVEANITGVWVTVSKSREYPVFSASDMANNQSSPWLRLFSEPSIPHRKCGHFRHNWAKKMTSMMLHSSMDGYYYLHGAVINTKGFLGRSTSADSVLLDTQGPEINGVQTFGSLLRHGASIES